VQLPFEEIGVELIAGSVFGQFRGVATLEFDGRWVCTLITLNSDGGKNAEIGLFRDTPNAYGQLFSMLERTILRLASECGEDWYEDEIRKEEKRYPAYSFDQRSFR
jgi:hypothetical protein